MQKKVRLDVMLVAKGLIESRERAKALIIEGKIAVSGIKITKSGTLVSPDASVEIQEKMPYVSRGGLKLQAALINYRIDVRGKIAMDVGASTGGFTDCLLQNGAKKVYAIDVGHGQLDWKLRNNPQVVLLEKTNIRYLNEILRGQSTTHGESAHPASHPPTVRRAGSEAGGVRLASMRSWGQKLEDLINSKIDIATIDVSFISLLKVIPKVKGFLTPEGEVLALIKPQFEVSRKDVGKGGVVKDDVKRQEVVKKITNNVKTMGFEIKGVMQSPIKGPKGNVEYFIYF